MGWVCWTKGAEEDATFCLIKDATFFPLFGLTNPTLDRDISNPYFVIISVLLACSLSS
jgi:hypothetical protein